jgi:succinyl-CoA synthetase beta subunit
MNIHEYQAREIFRAHGLPVPDSEVVGTPEGAAEAARRLGGRVVIKAQVHAGGRGKAGGVKLAADPEEAHDAAGVILGMEIKGLRVRTVLVAPTADIATEVYVGIVMDRVSQRPVMMVSPEGGVDIEEVAETKPEAIFKETIDPRYGLLNHQATRLSYRLFSDPSLARAAAGVLSSLWRAYRSADATLAEVNPLISTSSGEVLAIDAKMNIDDNALFRHRDIESMRDEEAEAPSERRAREAGLSYIKLEGSVACCVNGAGLAMATMDLVKYYGGDPANFLDIGGSSNPDKVVCALEIMVGDPNVRSILFNIFGGITRCDDVANGIVEATSRLDLRVPLTIRLTGTNEDEAVGILGAAGFKADTDMDRAVQRAVRAASAG